MIPEHSVEIVNIIRKLSKYYDIGFIFNNLESIIKLPIPFKTSKISFEQYKENKLIAKNSHKLSDKVHSKFNDELTLREETFNSIREKYPNFCKNIQDTLSKKEYNEYIELLKISLKNISEIIVHKKNDLNTACQEILLTKKDQISNIVDSYNATKLSYIEDNFVFSELENIDLNCMPEHTQQNIIKLKKLLLNRFNKHDSFMNYYSKGNKINIKNDEER